MGYNPNKQLVKRYEALLNFMLTVDGDFKQPSSKPRSLAYDIRRTIKAIESFPQTFEKYQPLINKFTLKEKQDHVLFVRRVELVEGEPIIVTPEGLAANRRLSIADVRTPLQIVGAAITHKAECLVYPDARPTDAELTKIYNWSSTNGYYIEIEPVFSLTKIKPIKAWEPST